MNKPITTAKDIRRMWRLPISAAAAAESDSQERIARRALWLVYGIEVPPALQIKVR